MSELEKNTVSCASAATAVADRPSSEGAAALGLTSDEAARQRELGKANVTNIKSGKSYLGIVLGNLLTYFNVIYAVVAVILVAVGSISNLTYLAVVIPNLLIAIIQEARAKAAVDKLSVTTEPRATVVRDGKEVDIDACEIVVGDVMRVELGRQVLSDAIILSGVCEANESMLTGESVPVKKEAGDRILAGSFIVSGTAYAEVDRVGNDNYVSSLEKEAKAFKAPSSNLFRDLNKFTRIIGWFILPPLTVALIISNWFCYDGNYTTILEKTSGSVVGMIPAGMYLLVTLTLSLSVVTLARKKTLVQDMYSIEMLASADVVCLDKTGTITDGTMEVTEVVPVGGATEGEIERIMSYVEGIDEGINATSKALIGRFGRCEGELLDRIPFSSSRKYSAADIREVGCFAIGAPHFVPCPISEDMERMIGEYAEQGKRVLVLAELDGINGEGRAVALIAIADRIRPSAAETIARFQSQDVTVKVISGDHAATVSTIARRVGIKNAEKYLSCENISDEQLVASVDDYAVFGRVTPEQKVLLVKALKAKGHTVAMTGDGVNDTLALKESNCAIAMADGSEVARKVSQIVLMNSDFSSLPSVVREGRRCINNVRQSATLFLMKTIFVIMVTLFSIVTVTGYPFTASKFIFLELLIIGLASVLLALEPNDKRIEGSFIDRVLIKSFPSALAMFIPILIILIVGIAHPILNVEGVGGISSCRDAVSMCVVTLVGFVNLVNICRPFTKWRAAVAAVIGGLLALVIPVGGLLDSMVFGNKFFNFPAAIEDPVFFGVMMLVGAACAVLVQLTRGPLEALIARVRSIGRKKN